MLMVTAFANIAPHLRNLRIVTNNRLNFIMTFGTSIVFSLLRVLCVNMYKTLSETF